MQEKTFTNQQIVNLKHDLSGTSPDALGKHRLPVDMLLALHRSTQDIDAAYKAYEETLNDLCGQYGVTKETIPSIAKDRAGEFAQSLNRLLEMETSVNIHQFDQKLLEHYDDGKYDPLTYTEIETLYLFAKEMEDPKCEK